MAIDDNIIFNHWIEYPKNIKRTLDVLASKANEGYFNISIGELNNRLNQQILDREMTNSSEFAFYNTMERSAYSNRVDLISTQLEHKSQTHNYNGKTRTEIMYNTPSIFSLYINSDKLVHAENLIIHLKDQLKDSSRNFTRIYTKKISNKFTNSIYLMATNYDCPILWNPKINHKRRSNPDDFILLGNFDQHYLKKFIYLDDSVSQTQLKQMLIKEVNSFKNYLAKKTEENDVYLEKLDGYYDYTKSSDFEEDRYVLFPLPMLPEILLTPANFEKDLDSYEAMSNWMNEHMKVANYLTKLVS